MKTHGFGCFPRAARALLALVVVSAPAAARADCKSLQATAIGAALDDPDAQYDLAVELYKGACVAKDHAGAAVLWRKAAAAGNVSAHNNLGWLTYHGSGVARDEQEGLRLWRYAAERGHAESQAHLAWACFEGRGVARDLVTAYAWARASLESSRLAPDLGGGAEVDAMARETLADVEKALGESDRPAAEQRAREFIARYCPAP